MDDSFELEYADELEILGMPRSRNNYFIYNRNLVSRI